MLGYHRRNPGVRPSLAKYTSDAARKVKGESETHGWIPGPVEMGSSLPLSIGELADLYRTNIAVSQEAENELSGHLPELHEVPRPEEFNTLVRKQRRLLMRKLKKKLDFRAELWQPVPQEALPQKGKALAAEFISAVKPLVGKDRWKLSAIYAGKYGAVHKQPWEQLVSLIEFVHKEAANAKEMLVRYGPVLPETHSFETQKQIATDIQQHLANGGKLGFFTLIAHGGWRQFIQASKVNGAKPSVSAHFRALQEQAHLKTLRRDLSERWDRLVAIHGAPRSVQIGEEPENTLIQFCGAIRDCLRWHETIWAPLETKLQALGFSWNKLMTEQPVIVGANGELIRIARAARKPLIRLLNARSNTLILQHLDKQIEDLREQLERSSRFFNSSRVIAELLDAVKRLDSDLYRNAHVRLVEVRLQRAAIEMRRALLKKLEAVAPAWAGAIRNRNGIHGQPEMLWDAQQAWVWRQLNDELDRRTRVSLEDLLSNSEKLREQLRVVTIELIDRRAWAFQTRRTSLPQRQALIGWLQTVERIKKGHGVRVPQLRVEAARKMSECRSAVPVWVMPLSRVVENFDPRVTRFDVVIIDEASQSDVMALVALYLGKVVLVVGDDEQVSPLAVGQDLSIIQNLISQHLHGIPNCQLYDGQMSIYDLAQQSFGGTTCLVEHFRCVAEIIQFSNAISYDGRIKPLRDASRVQTRPHTIAYRVSGSSRDGKVNYQEAAAIAALIVAAIEQPEYRKNEAGSPTSFGVVSLLGDEQAIEIDSLLRKRLSPDRYEQHSLLCGNAAQFQGDERDVVFLSLVDTAQAGPLPFRDQKMFKQRFNVAASRARDQMWVIHSLNPQNDLKANDLRRRLIEHATDPGMLMRALDEKERKTQSSFEREVLKRLMFAGFCVTPQWKVGACRIDLVVEGEGKRLAIECDGDRYHPIEKLREDMERQAILAGCGKTRKSRHPERSEGSAFHEKPKKMQIPRRLLRLGMTVKPLFPQPARAVRVDFCSYSRNRVFPRSGARHGTCV